MPLSLILLAALLALAQPADPPQKPEPLDRQVAAAIESKDFARAESLLLRQVSAEPASFVPRYNLACLRSLQGNAPAAMDHLVEALERGFVDLHQLRRDPHLAAARTDPRFARLVAAWPETLARHARANLDAARADFTQGTYRHTRDEPLRLDVLSAMDERSTADALAELRRVDDWSAARLFPRPTPEDAALDPYTVLVLPSPRDFDRWLAKTYSPAATIALSRVGGAYLHDQRRLVAQDLGPSLRHEFLHVLHWRSMSRLGQDHPIWIQEGLCSLVEDIEPAPAEPGQLRPVASWRTNIARRQLTAARLLPLDRLAKMPRKDFLTTTPLANYAQARTLFLWLADTGRLRDWYASYTDAYPTDPTGLNALEAAAKKPLKDLERDYRAWLAKLPEVAEALRPGAATLGVDVDPGAGDGVVIVALPELQRKQTNPAFRAGLRKGDVITHINDEPTRDLNELLRVLGRFTPGDKVEVTYRRGTTRATLPLTLVPRP